MRNRDIIKQYVNTGNRISEYQLKKLNNSLKNSYFRKRLINDDADIKSYELKYTDDIMFKKIVDHILEMDIKRYDYHSMLNTIFYDNDLDVYEKLHKNGYNIYYLLIKNFKSIKEILLNDYIDLDVLIKYCKEQTINCLIRCSDRDFEYLISENKDLIDLYVKNIIKFDFERFINVLYFSSIKKSKDIIEIYKSKFDNFEQIMKDKNFEYCLSLLYTDNTLFAKTLNDFINYL